MSMTEDEWKAKRNDVTSRQSRMRERRKAEGGKRVDVMLSEDGSACLAKLQSDFPNMTLGQLIEKAIVMASFR